MMVDSGDFAESPSRGRSSGTVPGAGDIITQWKSRAMGLKLGNRRQPTTREHFRRGEGRSSKTMGATRPGGRTARSDLLHKSQSIARSADFQDAGRLRATSGSHWQAQALHRSALGRLPPAVVAGSRGDVGMTGKLLHRQDIDPGVEHVGHSRPPQIMR